MSYMVGDTYHVLGLPVDASQRRMLGSKKTNIQTIIGSRQFFLGQEFAGVTFWADYSNNNPANLSISKYLDAAEDAKQILKNLQDKYQLAGPFLFLVANDENGISIGCDVYCAAIIPCLTDRESTIQALRRSPDYSAKSLECYLNGNVKDSMLDLESLGEIQGKAVYHGNVRHGRSRKAPVTRVALFEVLRSPMIFDRLEAKLQDLRELAFKIRKSILEGATQTHSQISRLSYLLWDTSTGGPDDLQPWFKEIGVRRDEYVSDDTVFRNKLTSGEQAALLEIEQQLSLKMRYSTKVHVGPKVAEYSTSDTSVSGLGLSRCELGAVPAAVCKFPKLEMLNLSANNLTELPPEIGELKSLRELNLSSNLFVVLPAELGLLPLLKVLRMDRNKVSSVSSGLHQVPNLKEVMLEGNDLEDLDRLLATCPRLEQLKIAQNSVQRLPNSIGSMVNLRVLDVRENQISAIPESMGNLTNLADLNLQDNPITKLPASFDKLVHLEALNLDDTDITTLPEVLATLPDLSYLRPQEWAEELKRRNPAFGKARPDSGSVTQKLTNETGEIKSPSLFLENQRKIIPRPPTAGNEENYDGVLLDELDYSALVSLEELIGEKIPEISYLDESNRHFGFVEENTHVVELHLYEKNIAQLPESIGNLRYLKLLSASRNKISQFPGSFWALNSLEELTLANNQIAILPENIGNLTHLRKLNVMMNHLDTLPDAIGQLPELVDVILAYNKFTAIPPPVKKIKQLRFLNVMKNPLTPESTIWIVEMRKKSISVLT